MDEYRVVGPDGREYGPVDLPGLQQWIREGRVLKDTRVRKNDGAVMSADLLAELSEIFRPPPPAPSVPPIASNVPVLAEFRSWGFIGQAWELVKPHWLVLSAMHLVALLIAGVISSIPIPIIAILAGMALNAVFTIGIIRATLGVLAGRTPDLEMMFGGFDRAGAAILAAFVMWVLITLGLFLLIVPGIIVALMVMMTNYVIAETQQDFWTAMKSSAELTNGYKWQLFCLCLALIPIMVLGLLACCIGVVVSLAVAMMAVALAYRFLQAKKAQPLTVVATVVP
jgi:uncharacterized membrane protein